MTLFRDLHLASPIIVGDCVLLDGNRERGKHQGRSMAGICIGDRSLLCRVRTQGGQLESPGTQHIGGLVGLFLEMESNAGHHCDGHPA